jgi:hypothetical protein
MRGRSERLNSRFVEINYGMFKGSDNRRHRPRKRTIQYFRERSWYLRKAAAHWIARFRGA